MQPKDTQIRHPASACYNAGGEMQSGREGIPSGCAGSAVEGYCHEFKKDEEAGDFGAGGDEGCGWNGRGLVYVGRPEVERDGGYFEAEADEGGDDGDDDKRIERGGLDRGGYLRKAGGACEAVEEAEAEEEKGGGHGAEQEVFERGFRRARVELVEGGEDVEREAEELQGKEENKKVLGCHEEHHADGGEKDERDELADVIGEGGVGGEQEGKDAQGKEDDLDGVDERSGEEDSVEEDGLLRCVDEMEDGRGAA